MEIPFLDLSTYHQIIKSEVFSRLEECYDQNAFCLGNFVEEFEEQLIQYSGIPHAVGVNSGTSALHLSLLALGIGPGDEVIVPSMTFISTAWGVCYCGATPIFADVDLASRNLTAEAVTDAITDRTKAVVVVHLYGQPAEMAKLKYICDKHGLALIEDAAQALGAVYHGQQIGSWGDFTCLSFYPGKNLGAIGEGGAILTKDPAHADVVKSLRNHGTSKTKYLHERIGYNYRMDGLQAAALGVKLQHYSKRNEERRRVAARYAKGLSRMSRIKIPHVADGIESVWHLYVILLENRDDVMGKLGQLGIQTGLHYPCPLHLQPCFKSLKQSGNNLENSELIANQCLSLPMYPELSDDAIDHVCEQLGDITN